MARTLDTRQANRLVSLFACLLPLSMAPTAHAATNAPQRPNILFIYTDDQSYRTVSCYPEAYPWARTPNIDRLADEGVRFGPVYIGTWCLPSRASLLTGLHPTGIRSLHSAGRYPGGTYDPAQCPFWPSVFRRHGYVTAQIGKWHTGNDTGYGRDWDLQVILRSHLARDGDPLPSAWIDWVRRYHQSVRALDEAVGKLLEALEESGQRDNTLVVFTSDQGLAVGQHGFLDKHAPYDANIATPLIVSMPGTLPQGKVCNRPVGGVDLVPTFFRVAGIDLPWKMHGRDLTPLLKNPQRDWPHPTLLIYTVGRFGDDTLHPPSPAKRPDRVPWYLLLRQGRYKYIRAGCVVGFVGGGWGLG
ncbi:MAG: sulfatase-like hydrolase/transferase [Thermoguttaceae bacterium]|nr:sulfatase-like hydrolase/transferase [Thermoguttaceae bacterium]